jgi:hypothetical protein
MMINARQGLQIGDHILGDKFPGFFNGLALRQFDNVV